MSSTTASRVGLYSDHVERNRIAGCYTNPSVGNCCCAEPSRVLGGRFDEVDGVRSCCEGSTWWYCTRRCVPQLSLVFVNKMSTDRLIVRSPVAHFPPRRVRTGGKRIAHGANRSRATGGATAASGERFMSNGLVARAWLILSAGGRSRRPAVGYSLFTIFVDCGDEAVNCGDATRSRTANDEETRQHYS